MMKRIECIDPFMKKMLDCCQHLSEIMNNKKIRFQRYFNEHLDKILICMIAAVIGITAFTEIYDRRDEEEILIGFNEFMGYEVDRLEIPTEGDVVLLKKIPSKEYEIQYLENGSVLIAGNFYYEIRPQSKFVPDLNRSDIHGNTPENCNYWGDMRFGTVLLSMNHQQHKKEIGF